MDIEVKVLLLGILKKEESESFNDVLIKLEEAQVFSLKEGKKLIKSLKSQGYLTNDALSIKGESTAKAVEKEFTL